MRGPRRGAGRAAMVATVLPDMEVAPDVGPDVPQAKPRKGGKKFMLAGEERMKRIQKQLKERRTKCGARHAQCERGSRAGRAARAPRRSTNASVSFVSTQE